ncbi:unnamed protein product [Protopolystoma xenopodis]|uniref:Uncharacterized protein n=1 Tax=Protopolystoma xenopodis TaxID=117903 RepID=A0A448WTJ2_9PLAT|nr:unnamed protein product [Protopolystoma xenopodis]
MEALGSSNGSCSLYDRHIPINRASSRLIEGAHKVLVGRRCISRNNQDDTATSTALQHMGDASDAHLDKLRACSSVDRMSNRLSQLSLSSTRPAGMLPEFNSRT